MSQNVIFVTGKYYHIYNRGVDKRQVFLDKEDYWKFFDCLRDLNNKTYYEERLGALGMSKHSVRDLKSYDFKRLGTFIKEQDKVVDVVSYTLNPNHFHLILKQLKDGGISNFMQKVSTSFTNDFNKKYDRSGALFQGRFKRIRIDRDEYLLWLLGYVNGNVEIYSISQADNYPWSSFQAIWKEFNSFQESGLESLSNLSVLSGLDIVFSQFSSAEEFKNLIKQVIIESRVKKEMKQYLLEEI